MVANAAVKIVLREPQDEVYWRLGAYRESGWLSSSTPPVVPGTYLTRSPNGLVLLEWRNRRWQGVRTAVGPTHWKGVDVSLSDPERDLLHGRLFQRRIEAALPLLRDAYASYAGSLGARLDKAERTRLKLGPCRYFEMLLRDKEGKKLLTTVDKKLVQPLIVGLKPRERVALREGIEAFKSGVLL